ncbi:MAG: maleylacetoacetate isomerase [Gammaproteobacteria bacterium]|nr:maleylacetoacetate isomerase [Gammaproteobacteria bacterium]
MYKLYHYFRSSSSYRVRIALNLKKLPCQFHPIDLRVGEQLTPEYERINQQHIVPTLITPAGVALNQSLAIIEYLEERYPTPALLPIQPELRAQIRAFACALACEIHPINNLRVLNYLKKTLHQSEPAVNAWYQHWVNLTLIPLEKISRLTSGHYTFGDSVSLADIVLIPQIYNARRYQVDMTPFPTLNRIEQNCLMLDSFQKAHPDRFA